MNDPVFADGVFFKGPREGAPDFVKGSVSIKTAEAIPFLQANEDNGWVNLDLKQSKGGKLYFQLNTWKPKSNTAEAADGLDDDIPF